MPTPDDLPVHTFAKHQSTAGPLPEGGWQGKVPPQVPAVTSGHDEDLEEWAYHDFSHQLGLRALALLNEIVRRRGFNPLVSPRDDMDDLWAEADKIAMEFRARRDPSAAEKSRAPTW